MAVRGRTDSQVDDQARDGGDEGGPVGYFIKTLEGTSYMLDKNDYIIKGVKGEFYPCKPDVFEMTYEMVEN
jgi:hypothetical protein